MKNLILKILLFVLTFWVAVSIVRTLNNLSKIFTEEIVWIRKTDNQKRLAYFDGSFLLSECIKKSVPKGKNIIIYTNNLMDFFYIRYQVYPIKVYLSSSIQNLYSAFYKKDFQYLIKESKLKQGFNLPNDIYEVSTCKSGNRILANIYKL